jgi:hypothetical protein
MSEVFYPEAKRGSPTPSLYPSQIAWLSATSSQAIPIWREFEGLCASACFDFQFRRLPILAILAIFYSPLPASLSQKPHPAYEFLLQTKAKLQFDRAMTARSKLFRGPLSGLFLAECRLLTADSLFSKIKNTHSHPEAQHIIAPGDWRIKCEMVP